MEETGDFQEKRVFKRFPVHIPLTCCDNFGNLGYAETQDISMGGVGITLNRGLPTGSIVEIFLQIPDNGQKIYRKATVIWSLNVTGKYRAGLKLKDSILNPIALALRTVNYQRRYSST
ncbi:MAG: PilZ domain-containing protein [Candidatus Omnitrophica bacterium]|nr:PilZ domain-containing protein [Candidatus Omnitrophota bacterium]